MKFVLEGAIVPKARPRVSNNRARLPDNYRAWRHDAGIQLLGQPRPSNPLTATTIDVDVVRLLGV